MRPVVLAALTLLSACGHKAAPPSLERRQVIDGLALSQSDRGHPAWTLHSQTAVLREDQDLADLQSPDMDFYQDGSTVSHVTSLTGVVQTVTHDVRLSSSVVLDSYQDHSRLYTEILYYSSKTGLFHTDEEVKIVRPEGVSYGKGMEATPDLTVVKIFRQHSVLSGKTK